MFLAVDKCNVGAESQKLTIAQIRFITPLQAMKLWGSRVLKFDGMSWLINDGQCESRVQRHNDGNRGQTDAPVLDHYYHFAAELLLGIWRTYASLDQDITANGITKLPAPKRMWFLHQAPDEWCVYLSSLH